MVIMKYQLWLDDKRNPSNFGVDDTNPGELVPILWARDVEQAKFYVKTLGAPSAMWLDHDLGEIQGEHEDYWPQFSTSMDFLKWLAENHFESIKGMRWYYLTNNLVGKQNMESFLKSWAKVSEGDPYRTNKTFLDVIEPGERCGKGLCGNEAQPAHSCPYASDVGNDSETLCNCCDECTHECAMDI